MPTTEALIYLGIQTSIVVGPPNRWSRQEFRCASFSRLCFTIQRAVAYRCFSPITYSKYPRSRPLNQSYLESDAGISILKYVKQEWDSAGSQKSHAAIVTRAERLPLTGSGNESGVDWRSAEETDQNALVVDAVDNCRTDSIRVVHRLEGLGAHCVYESVRVVRAVGVQSDHLPFVIQTQGLCPRGGRKMEEFEPAEDQKETVIDSFGIHEEPANVSGIVDTCGLRTGRAGDIEQLENGAELVVDVRMIGAGTVRLGAVVAGSLAEVVLAEELIKGRARIADFQESTSGICETVGVSCGGNVKAGGLGIVVDGDDLGLGRTRSPPLPIKLTNSSSRTAARPRFPASPPDGSTACCPRGRPR